MKGRQIAYTQQQKDWVKENCTLPIKDLHSGFCIKFNRDDVSAVNLNALRKRNGWKTGRTGKFEKGNTPHPDAKPKGPNSTSFKKGAVPKNTKPLYSERVCPKDDYVLIKIPEKNPNTGAPTRFKHKHVWIWEKENGTVPKGHAIVFVDGNKRNFHIENLQCVPRGVLGILNKALKASEHPVEARPTLLAMARIQYKTRQLEKAA